VVTNGRPALRQAPPGLAASAERDPGRRARAGVNEIDPLLGDQTRQARHVERHRQRILGRGGKRREHAADRLQLAGEPPPLRRDERARADSDEGCGDVDRRPLGAAGVEPGNDLQNRAARQRSALGAAEGGERRDAHASRRARTSRAPRSALTAGAASAIPAAPAIMKPRRIIGSI
jgi:hypothetical protein